MIKKLRRKFILVASGAIFIILTFVLTCILGLFTYYSYNELNALLDYISQNNGNMPAVYHQDENDPFTHHIIFKVNINDELAYETRYFSVITDSSNNVVRSDFEHISAVSVDETDHFLTLAQTGKRQRGKIEDDGNIYYFLSRPLTAEQAEMLTGTNTADYRLTVFLDCTRKLYTTRMIVQFSLSIGLISMLLFIVIVSVFSRRAIQPTVDSYEKQKEFITNAGHELKTPLAIISANTEVIEMTTGSNEWTQSIINQVKRLTGLVNRLITIARLDEGNSEKIDLSQEVDLSAYASELATSFEAVASQQGKAFEHHIAENVKVKGDRNSIRELYTILIDNAIKYCDEGGTVRIELSMKRKSVFSVSNTFAEGEGKDYSRYFERFYRGDTSHSHEKAGYGIGLSMARSVAELHKGKIEVSYKDGMITFTAIL